MSYAVVAACAHHAKCVRVRDITINGLRDGGVTAAAGILGNVQIQPRDSNIVGIPTAGEVEGMEEPI